jgi:hypothetical protein
MILAAMLHANSETVEESEPETFALFREALLCLRRRSAGPLDDDTALLSMARHVLGQRREDGRASYQIALGICSACGTAQQRAGGELIAVGADIVAMAHCDGQHLGHIPARAANENALPIQRRTDAEHLRRDIPSRAANENARPGHARTDGDNPAVASDPARTVQPCSADQPETRPLGTDAPAPAQRRSDAPDELLRAEHAHVGAPTSNTHAGAVDAELSVAVPQTGTPTHTRATQTIPPALRRAVLTRDQHCCRVPGCRNATFLDLHHIELRSEGGRNVLGNILTLCGAHHRSVHQGSLLIEKDATGGVRFRHADGNAYGHVPEPQTLEIQAKLFSVLRGLGFREGEVRAVLTALRQDNALRDASIEHLLREALRRIRPASSRS